MSTFASSLTTKYDREASKLLGSDFWRVMSPFSYMIKPGHWVSVPAGYLTDGATVPRIFWNIIPPWGLYGEAAVVHDILCEYLTIVVNGLPVAISRAQCDQVLNEAMMSFGVPKWKRLAIYWAVCAFRVVARVDEPSNNPLKRKLEAEWREEP